MRQPAQKRAMALERKQQPYSKSHAREKKGKQQTGMKCQWQGKMIKVRPENRSREGKMQTTSGQPTYLQASDV